jgi:hypothetical protein
VNAPSAAAAIAGARLRSPTAASRPATIAAVSLGKAGMTASSAAIAKSRTYACGGLASRL